MTRHQAYAARAPLPRIALLAATGVLALLLAACGAAGNDDDSASGSDDEAAREDAMLDYAACMRDHGVPMDDPEPGEGGLMINGRDVDPEVVHKAEEACSDLLEDALPGEGTGEMPAEQKEALLAQAQCMREHGWDVPDPQFDGGRVTQRLDGGVDPDDPAFQADQEECAEESGADLPRMEGP